MYKLPVCPGTYNKNPEEEDYKNICCKDMLHSLVALRGRRIHKYIYIYMCMYKLDVCPGSYNKIPEEEGEEEEGGGRRSGRVRPRGGEGVVEGGGEGGEGGGAGGGEVGKEVSGSFQ